mmetsp:Transcript_23753/g.62080  ORF Transcript_23753/g.62080 Transcript_23753/m.62080 type:complete len:254 (-) Transcript_23753:233-994(-)
MWATVGVVVLAVTAAPSGNSECAASDAALRLARDTVCVSLEAASNCPPGSANVTAKGDWPSQVVYYTHVLDLVAAAPSACLMTDVGRATLQWLNTVNVTVSPWWNTWLVFQVQYYDMPRKPGARIESPATLGRKCWAFSYLAQRWPSLKPKIVAAVHHAHLSVDRMVAAYDSAVPLTLGLCDRVLTNCFVNASYDAGRNGTCLDAESQFYVGFQWENGIRNDTLRFRFATYTQTAAFHDAATFAVNTAVNYII